jgi:hypothetical protein
MAVPMLEEQIKRQKAKMQKEIRKTKIEIGPSEARIEK